MCEKLSMSILSLAAAFWTRCNLENFTFGSPDIKLLQESLRACTIKRKPSTK